MKAQIATTAEQVVTIARDYLNRDFSEMKKFADLRHDSRDRASAAEYRYFVMEYITPARLKKADLSTVNAVICFAACACAYARKKAFTSADRQDAAGFRNLHLRQMGCM